MLAVDEGGWPRPEAAAPPRPALDTQRQTPPDAARTRPGRRQDRGQGRAPLCTLPRRLSLDDELAVPRSAERTAPGLKERKQRRRELRVCCVCSLHDEK